MLVRHHTSYHVSVHHRQTCLSGLVTCQTLHILSCFCRMPSVSVQRQTSETPNQQTDVPSRPFQIVAADIVDPLNTIFTKGNRHIFYRCWSAYETA